MPGMPQRQGGLSSLLRKGRVEAWLEIHRKVIGRVCVDSQTPASELHDDLKSADDFDNDPSTWRNGGSLIAA